MNKHTVSLKLLKNKRVILFKFIKYFLEESSYASRPPTVYNEIYKSADYNGFRNGGYPGHHGRQGN